MSTNIKINCTRPETGMLVYWLFISFKFSLPVYSNILNIFFLFLWISALYLNLIFQLFGVILQKYKCISGETFLGENFFHVAAFLIFWSKFPLMMAEKTAEMSWQMEYGILIVKYNQRFYLYVYASSSIGHHYENSESI